MQCVCTEVRFLFVSQTLTQLFKIEEERTFGAKQVKNANLQDSHDYYPVLKSTFAFCANASILSISKS